MKQLRHLFGLSIQNPMGILHQHSSIDAWQPFWPITFPRKDWSLWVPAVFKSLALLTCPRKLLLALAAMPLLSVLLPKVFKAAFAAKAFQLIHIFVAQKRTSRCSAQPLDRLIFVWQACCRITVFRKVFRKVSLDEANGQWNSSRGRCHCLSNSVKAFTLNCNQIGTEKATEMAIVQRDIIVKNDKHFPKRHLDFQRDSLKKACCIFGCQWQLHDDMRGSGMVSAQPLAFVLLNQCSLCANNGIEYREGFIFCATTNQNNHINQKDHRWSRSF